MTDAAYIYDALRTPRGKNRGGALHSVKPLDLVVGLLSRVAPRNPGLDLADIDDIVLGVVSPVGEQGGDLARTAALAGGLPQTVAGVQLNRFCASGLEAVNTGAAKVLAGDSFVLAGGVESMSRVPMGSDGGAYVQDPAFTYDAYFVPQGIGADLIATLAGFTREDVDRFALESQQRAVKAIADGRFDRGIEPVRDLNGVLVLDHDEHVRPGSSMESLGALAPAFAQAGEQAGFDAVAVQRYPDVERVNHVHTAGNSSGIVDGAALVLLGSREAGQRAGLAPRARIRSTAVIGSEPTIMLTGPTPATLKALDRAGMTVGDIDLFELNEAFASVVLKWMRDLDIPHDKVNVNGGAIALGHPLGATGAMILGTVLDELERRDLSTGLVTLCVGAGMGIATVIERL